MPNEYARTEEGFNRFAAACNQAGKNLSQEGATYAYHNHSFEFHRFNGLSGQEMLLRYTNLKDFCSRTCIVVAQTPIARGMKNMGDLTWVL